MAPPVVGRPAAGTTAQPSSGSAVLIWVAVGPIGIGVFVTVDVGVLVGVRVWVTVGVSVLVPVAVAVDVGV